jgi:hypothetical protein
MVSCCVGRALGHSRQELAVYLDLEDCEQGRGGKARGKGGKGRAMSQHIQVIRARQDAS